MNLWVHNSFKIYKFNHHILSQIWFLCSFIYAYHSLQITQNKLHSFNKEEGVTGMQAELKNLGENNLKNIHEKEVFRIKPFRLKHLCFVFSVYILLTGSIQLIYKQSIPSISVFNWITIALHNNSQIFIK